MSLELQENGITNACRLDLAGENLMLKQPANTVPLTDPTVQTVIGFFGVLKLYNLSEEFIRMADTGRIFRSGIEIAEPYGAIVLDENDDVFAKLADITSQFLRIYENDMLEGDIAIITKALKEFSSSRDSFNPENYIPEKLFLALRGIDMSLNPNASNENGLNLHPIVYEKMVDLQGITMEDCEKAGIIIV